MGIKFRSERITAASRTGLRHQLELEETQKTGVYILIGAYDGPSHSHRVYIGESDNVAVRLGQHRDEAAKNSDYKPWWDETITITSHDSNLTKAHGLYLESALIKQTVSSDRASLDNGQRSDRSETLSRADRSDMQVFLNNIFVMMSLLGVDFFKPALTVSAPGAVDSPEEAAQRSPLFVARFGGQDLAVGQEVDSKLVVQKGSRAQSWIGIPGGYESQQKSLVDAGTLAQSEGTAGKQDYTFQRDHAFGSLSAAASAVLGRISNGRIE